MSLIKSYRDLEVYQKAMNLVVQILKLTRDLPVEEKYSLTDQIRRSSRSVCANLAEAWRKRRYEAAFISKLSDAETEAAETQVWAEIAFQCGYWDERTYSALFEEYENVIGKIIKMADNPGKWVIRTGRRRVGEGEKRRAGERGDQRNYTEAL